MRFISPEHSRSRVVAAGKVIARRRGHAPRTPEQLFRAYDVAGNWRSAHAWPLHVLSMTLQNRAKKVDPGALVARRLKRLPSIITKLRRFKHMELSQMQDLGGCRAVVETIDGVDQLVHLYKHRPLKTALFSKAFDHIAKPKSDGYRSVHLVYKYKSSREKYAIYDGLRIEIQIRSKLQHLWATAVETIDTFTDQALKSGLGDRDWQRFFLLMSGHFAGLEKCPSVPSCPLIDVDLQEELKELCFNLNVINTFHGLMAGLEILNADMLPAAAYILILDAEEKTTFVEMFNDIEQASGRYIELEKETIENPHMQVVMVSVDSVFALKRAYPNYYFDTQEFVDYIEELTYQ